MDKWEMKQRMAQDLTNRQYGKRQDGTNKGLGWRGEIKLPDGSVATELSVGVNIDGEEVLLPLITPDTTDEEAITIHNTQDPKNIPKELLDKAVDHAIKRIKTGLSPFNE